MPVTQTPSLWTVPVDWGSPFRVRYDFQTEVKESRNRKEQRVSWRETPRKSFEFTCTLHGAKLRRFQGLLNSRQPYPWIVAEVPRRLIHGGLNATSDTLEIEGSLPSWLQVGSYLVFELDGEMWHSQVIDITGNDVQLDDSAQRTWPTYARVYSGVPCFTETMRVREHTTNAAVVSAEFSAIPGIQLVDPLPAAPASFNERELWTLQPNWGQNVNSDWAWGRELVDFGLGVVDVEFPWTYGSRGRQFGYTKRSFADAEAIREFFFRQRGRQGEFYMPTGANDLPLFNARAASDTFFLVEGTDTFVDYANSTVYAAVSIHMNDGSVLRKLVDGFVQSGANTRVNLVGALGADITPETVARISWMPAQRFAADGLQVDWLTNTVAQMQFSTVTLEDLPEFTDSNSDFL